LKIVLFEIHSGYPQAQSDYKCIHVTIDFLSFIRTNTFQLPPALAGG
jgi:hypothetical protein